jgi:putative glutamine amidotransferase
VGPPKNSLSVFLQMRKNVEPFIGIPCSMQEPQDELGSEASATPQSYLRAVELAGAVPLLIPITQQETTLREIYGHIHGLLLVGGVDIQPQRYHEQPHPALGKTDPKRDWVELVVASWALSDGLPILGICRGIQLLNIIFGGTLWQDVGAQASDTIEHNFHPGYAYNRLSHSVHLERHSRLAEVFGDLEVQVNSLHHQAVKVVGKGLSVTARAPDGIVEGLEGSNTAWVTAVQWHPEWLLEDDPRMKRLFETFVVRCSECQR